MLVAQATRYILPIAACICFLIFIHIGRKVTVEGISSYFVAGTIALIAVIIAEVAEEFFASPYCSEPNWQRWVFSILAYMLRPAVAYIMLLIPIRGEKKLSKFMLSIPLIINAVFLLASPITGIVFYYDEFNKYTGGTLKYLPFFVGGIYLVYFVVFCIIKMRSGAESEILVSISTFVMCGIAVALESKFGQLGSLPTACITNMIFYYVYFYMDCYSRDSLTGAYRRRMMYSDVHTINAHYFITFDVNGLKQINDNMGHIAGDTALKCFGEAVVAELPRQAKFYRMGGDEFAIFYPKVDYGKILTFLDKVQKRLDPDKVPFGVSYGVARFEDASKFDEAYRKADEMLYENKQAFWENFHASKTEQ